VPSTVTRDVDEEDEDVGFWCCFGVCGGSGDLRGGGRVFLGFWFCLVVVCFVVAAAI
jgi:hypothetical protein